jgi:copper chaperone CopZ
MRKVFDLENLDCAHCAAKMEDGIRALDGVREVSVNFLTQKLVLETEDAVFQKVLKQAVKICRRIEPDCEILVK